MKNIGTLAAFSLLFAMGCGSVQDETKAAPKVEECKDAPGKVFVVLANDAGKSICNGTAAVDMRGGQNASKNAGALGDIEGAPACGFEMSAAGSAVIRSPGFAEVSVNWDQPAKCKTSIIKVTLK